LYGLARPLDWTKYSVAQFALLTIVRQDEHRSNK